jgi:hypothetical protein
VKIGYRAQQFFRALTAAPSQQDYQEVEAFLQPGLMDLFSGMQPGEQAHSIQIYHSLAQNGVQHPDLLAAALLHDAGKSRLPLRLWERVYIVLAKALFPHLVVTWGQAAIQDRAAFWKRAFIVAVQHPEWGAEMAAGAGASVLTVNLIRNHQIQEPEKHREIPEHEVELLKQLQSFDNAF